MVKFDWKTCLGDDKLYILYFLWHGDVLVCRSKKMQKKYTHKPWTMQKLRYFPYCWNMMHWHDDDDLLCRLQLTRRLVPTLGRPRRPGNNLRFYIFQSISFVVCFYPSAPFLCQFKWFKDSMYRNRSVFAMLKFCSKTTSSSVDV